jgi:hypothetical protein
VSLEKKSPVGTNGTEEDWDRPIKYVDGIKSEIIPSFDKMIEERFPGKEYRL